MSVTATNTYASHPHEAPLNNVILEMSFWNAEGKVRHSLSPMGKLPQFPIRCASVQAKMLASAGARVPLALGCVGSVRVVKLLAMTVHVHSPARW